MGGEGIAIIAALAFVAFSVIPTINRHLAIISRTVIDERFAPELRMLNTQPRCERNSHLRGVNLNHETGLERGKIYYSERKMVSNETGEKSTQQIKQSMAPSALRKLARDRAMAKVRIQKRRSIQRNLFIGCFLLGMLTIAAWIAVPLTQFSAGYGVAGVLFTIITAGIYDYTRRNYREANLVDQEIISSNTRAMREVTGRVRKSEQAAREPLRNAKQATAKVNAAASFSESAASADEATLHDKAQQTMHGTDAVAKRSETDSAARKISVAEDSEFSVPSVQKTAAATRIAAAAKPAAETESAAAPKAAQIPAKQRNSAGAARAATAQTSGSGMPSYTVKPKIRKRKVAPYAGVNPDAAAQGGNVPYRPVRLGERLGQEEPKVANPAPQMNGKEELRSDLLGGGIALDALLERRRA